MLWLSELFNRSLDPKWSFAHFLLVIIAVFQPFNCQIDRITLEIDDNEDIEQQYKANYLDDGPASFLMQVQFIVRCEYTKQYCQDATEVLIEQF